MAIKTTAADYPRLSSLKDLSIDSIASIISQDWSKTAKSNRVDPTAAPYLSAMRSMHSITDNYGADSGKSIVLYFLCNASQWKGEVARLIKAELNRRCK